ncbi:MAG TPA: redoxin domain-containing protein [Acidimicrobiia bacterium]|nr:redoxin domain-containing protein [Acidimicrobiia bacterium]
MLDPGTRLPEFTALDDQGRPVRSADWRGRWTVLWWYVRADTPG